MLTAFTGLILIALFSVLGFWRMTTLAFMAAAGVSMMLGLAIPDVMTDTTATTGMDVTVGLSLVAYSLFCIACAYKTMFWRGSPDEAAAD